MAHELKLEEKGNLCFYDGKYVNLSRREFDLLYILVKRPNTIVSYDEIRDKVFFGATNNHINTTMSRVRNKLPGVEIRTKNGIGYGYII